MKTLILLIAMMFYGTFLFSQTSDSTKKTSTFQLDLGIGAGLIRNTASPSIEASFSHKHKNKWEIGINTITYFFFEQSIKANNTKDFKAYINTFLNAEFLINGLFNNENTNKKDWKGFGLGYLIDNNGGYFKGATAKLYFISRYKYFTIIPEIIFTDDFKSMFPGFTIVF